MKKYLFSLFAFLICSQNLLANQIVLTPKPPYFADRLEKHVLIPEINIPFSANQELVIDCANLHKLSRLTNLMCKGEKVAEICIHNGHVVFKAREDHHFKFINVPKVISLNLQAPGNITFEDKLGI